MTPAERQAKIRGIVIEHDRHVEAMQGFKEFHRPVDGGAPATGVVAAMVGDSRTGKSFSAKRYAKSHPQKIGETGLIMPVVFADMPMEGGGGPRAMLEYIAWSLQLPFSQRMNNLGLVSAILRTLVERKTELLILDEFEQLFLGKNTLLVGFARGLLRKLANLDTLTIVCVGLPQTYEILRADPQLVGRGGLPYKVLRPYDWENTEERLAFCALCDAFDVQLPFDEPSGLARQDFAQRLDWVSKGSIGILKAYTEAAAFHAINDGSACLEYHHFEQAYELRKKPGDSYNPFRDDIPRLPKKGAERAARVTKIGAARDIFSKQRQPDILNGA